MTLRIVLPHGAEAGPHLFISLVPGWFFLFVFVCFVQCNIIILGVFYFISNKHSFSTIFQVVKLTPSPDLDFLNIVENAAQCQSHLPGHRARICIFSKQEKCGS